MEIMINLDLLILQVETLAAANSVRIDYLPDDVNPLEFAAADPNGRLVHIPRVTDDVTYLIALHEIGHLVAEGGTDRKREAGGLVGATAKMETEDASWHWCKAQAVIWTLEMEGLHGWARETYRKNYVHHFKEERMPFLKKSIKEWR